jgi:hypothetical protein
MRKCKSCGGEFCKGKAAFILTAEGLRGAVVCLSCHGSGAVIVAPAVVPWVDVTKAERREAKEVLDPFEKRVVALLRMARKARDSANNADEKEVWDIKVEVYEAVLRMLEEQRA